MLSALLIVLATARQETPPAERMAMVSLVFLKTGQPVEMSEKEAAETQGRHLQFLEGLWQEGKALAVGPLMDGGEIRGLVVLAEPDVEKAKQTLAEDPFVKSGALKLEVHQWYTAVNRLHKGPKFLDLESYWFGLLTRPETAPNLPDERLKEIQAGHMDNIRAMAASGHLLLAGPMGGNGRLRGIFVFRDGDKKDMEALAAKDPAIQAGRLRLDLYKWLTAKGTIKP
jgi:uncharacterized protein YciI